jgi:hypothetical protein
VPHRRASSRSARPPSCAAWYAGTPQASNRTHRLTSAMKGGIVTQKSRLPIPRRTLRDTSQLVRACGRTAEKFGWLEEPVHIDEMVDLGYIALVSR